MQILALLPILCVKNPNDLNGTWISHQIQQVDHFLGEYLHLHSMASLVDSNQTPGIKVLHSALSSLLTFIIVDGRSTQRSES